MLFLFFLIGCAFAAKNIATIKKLPNTVEGAACLDGTPPAYYFAPGSGTGAHKWFIYHQGGGWCTSMENCFARSNTTLGSSKTYSKEMDLGDGFFSKDPAVNTVMHNWNKVFIKYCDGASFAGNASVQDYKGHKMYFRGFLNLQAYLKDMITSHSLHTATHVVISGGSAGGLATYLHTDWYAQQLPKANVKAMPDSGFFLDYNAPGNGPKYGNNMRWVFKAQNCQAGVNQACIAANKGKESNCFFAEHTAPHIKTPLFPLQSEYDSWQSKNILGSQTPTAMNTYGVEFIKRFRASVLKQSRNGVFLDSCFHHSYYWDRIRINGTLTHVAFSRWYTGLSGVYIQDKKYPCEACCHP